MREHYQAKLKATNGAVDGWVSASPLVDEIGRYGGSLAMVTDVSAVREAEDILRSQSWRVQEMDEGHLDGNPPTS